MSLNFTGPPFISENNIFAREQETLGMKNNLLETNFCLYLFTVLMIMDSVGILSQQIDEFEKRRYLRRISISHVISGGTSDSADETYRILSVSKNKLNFHTEDL